MTCPWHGSQYDVRTGRALRGPYRIPVVSRLLTGLAKPRTTYPARIVGGSVEVDLDAASRTASSWPQRIVGVHADLWLLISRPLFGKRCLDEERCRKREGPHSRSGVTASLARVDVPAG